MKAGVACGAEADGGEEERDIVERTEGDDGEDEIRLRLSIESASPHRGSREGRETRTHCRDEERCSLQIRKYQLRMRRGGPRAGMNLLTCLSSEIGMIGCTANHDSTRRNDKKLTALQAVSSKRASAPSLRRNARRDLTLRLRAPRPSHRPTPNLASPSYSSTAPNIRRSRRGRSSPDSRST